MTYKWSDLIRTPASWMYFTRLSCFWSTLWHWPFSTKTLLGRQAGYSGTLTAGHMSAPRSYVAKDGQNVGQNAWALAEIYKSNKTERISMSLRFFFYHLPPRGTAPLKGQLRT